MPLLVAWQHTPTHLQLRGADPSPRTSWYGADLQCGFQLGPGQTWGLEGLGPLAPPSVLMAVLFPRMGPQGLLLQQVPAW